MHGQHTRRASQATDQMLPQCVRPRDTVEERLAEREVHVQDLPIVQQWQKTPQEITEWLAMHNPGPSKAASIRARQWASSRGSGWQDNNWGSVPPRLVVGRQPEGMEMKVARHCNPPYTQEAHITQPSRVRNVALRIGQSTVYGAHGAQVEIGALTQHCALTQGIGTLTQVKIGALMQHGALTQSSWRSGTSAFQPVPLHNVSADSGHAIHRAKS